MRSVSTRRAGIGWPRTTAAKRRKCGWGSVASAKRRERIVPTTKPNRTWVQLSVALAVAVFHLDAQSQVLSDPFHTGSRLQRDTTGLTDPLGHDCAVPGGGLTFEGAANLALC